MLRKIGIAYMFSLFVMISYAQTTSISGVVYDQFGPLAGAKIEIDELNLTTSSNVQGEYKIEVEPGIYTVRASYLFYEFTEYTVKVSFNNQNPVQNFTLILGSVADEKIVIGSKSTPVSQLDKSVPVEVISAQEIAQTNQTSLGQVLQYLLPSFHSTHQTIADGTDHSDPATLRGLGPDQLLVLLNGKRYHSSSLLNINGTVGRGTVGVDFNSIPVGAIQKIEILKDGAAAQYGSDAIAGVINIVLKEQSKSFRGLAEIQPTIQGDGLETVLSGNYGASLFRRGFINVTAEMRQKESVNRSGNYTGNVYSTNDSLDALLVEQNKFFSRTSLQDKKVMAIGGGKMQDASVFFNAKYPFQNKTEIYAFGGFNNRQGGATGFYRFPFQEDRVVSGLYPHGFLPKIETNISDNQLTTGIKGEKNGWNIDLSQTSGSNTFELNVSSSNNASMGGLSPTNFFAGAFTYNQTFTSLDFSKQFDSVPVLQKVNIAFGGIFRYENYILQAGDPASYIDGGDTTSLGNPKASGSQLFPGFSKSNEVDKFRHNSAAYIELEAEPNNKLLVAGAIRNESFSDFGRNFSWKLATRYKILKSIAIRSSYNTGFRAPSLHQIYFNNIGLQIINFTPSSVGTFNNESPVTKAFGVEKLKAETSSNATLGVSVKASKNTSFSMDAYNIDIKDRIVLSGRFGSAYKSILEPLGADEAQFFTNAIHTNTKGIDVSIRSNYQLNNGLLQLSANYNYSKTKVGDEINVPSILVGQETTLFNREEVSRIEKAQPLSKAIITANYHTGRWNFLVRATRFGMVSYIHPSDGNINNWELNELTGKVESRDQEFSPKILTDVNVSYKFLQNLKLIVGGTNIFDVYPDKHKHSSNISSGRFVYSRRVQQFGVRGASYFAKVIFLF